MKTKLLLVAIFILQSVALAVAQTPQSSPTPTQEPPKPDDIDVVRITTNLVQMDAVVTDNKGKIVTDLKPEEVQIFEDGRQQRVTHFSFVTTESPASAGVPETKPKPADKNAPPVPPTRLKPEDIRRTIAIVVDDLGLSFESTYYVRRALKKFVDEQMQPGDLVAIIRTSGGMGALQSFTADKRQLYAAIDRVKWYANGRAGVAAFAPIESPPFSGDAGAAIDAANEDLKQLRDDMFAVGTLGALSYVVRGLRELPGRKSILLISDGFKLINRNQPSRNMGAEIQSNNDRTMQGLQALIDKASRASVVIYTMNATGLQTLSLTAADDTSGRSSDEVNQAMSGRRLEAFDMQSGLDYLAENTGGIAIRNTNDLAGGIKRIMADQRGYYLIGFRPDESTFDPRTGRRRFHHLTLKVSRPGKFNVRMRNGFFGVTDEERNPPQTLAQKLVSALSSPFGATGVHLQLTSLFANDAKAGSFMRSLLHIDPHDLTFTDEPDGMHKCVFDVLSITFGDNGVSLDQTGRTYTLKLPDEWYKRTMRSGLVYQVTVPIKKPGAYQLRISLRDSNSDRIGSASQFIEVPDLKKNRLALSGVVISGANPGAGNTSASPTQSQEGAAQGNSEASPGVRHFRHGMLMEYAFVIYNARSDKTTNRPELITQVRLLRDGKPVFTGKELPFNVTDQADLKRLSANGGIQLGTDLAPGEYVLQLVVKDMLADEKHRTVTQWMDFEIVK